MTTKDIINRRLGNNIRACRIRCGWTQDELAEKVGYTSNSRHSTIAKIEAGKSDLPASKVCEFAKVFGVSPDELLKAVYDEIAPSTLYELVSRAEENAILLELLESIYEMEDKKILALLGIIKVLKGDE